MFPLINPVAYTETDA